MSHRAQQIVDAIATALEANASLGAAVYKYRNASLSEDEQEVPAVSIGIGQDAPLDESGAANFKYIDSLLELEIAATVREDDEPSAVAALLDIRRQVHITLMADRTQGLSFVIDTRYGGSEAPAVDFSADRATARMSGRWAVHYRMNISDPN